MIERALWHPVLLSSALAREQIATTTLLNERIALWRDDAGVAHAWLDRCPHRGASFSLGCVRGAHMQCGYHGWTFDAHGTCVHIPALSADASIPAAQNQHISSEKNLENSAQSDIPKVRGATVFHIKEAYGMLWIALDTPSEEIPPFPEFSHPHLRKVFCGPYDVHTSAPRIVENFLDMAHFGYVHGGILGDLAHTQVPNYEVSAIDDARGRGILASKCLAWQPKSNATIQTGSMVEYTYRVVHPFGAILTKIPQAQDGFDEAIALLIQPMTEEFSRAWFILAMTDFANSDETLRNFQDTIFAQDKPIVESQLPKRLPLDLRAEAHCAVDRMSSAYRRLLAERGVRFGVVS